MHTEGRESELLIALAQTRNELARETARANMQEARADGWSVVANARTADLAAANARADAAEGLQDAAQALWRDSQEALAAARREVAELEHRLAEVSAGRAQAGDYVSADHHRRELDATRREIAAQQAAIAWACGDAPLPDGRWFDPVAFGHIGKVAPYWWRSILRLYSGVAARRAALADGGEM